MPSFQIATCQAGGAAAGIVQHNSYEATLLRRATIVILLCFTGGLVKHDLKRKAEEGLCSDLLFNIVLRTQMDFVAHVSTMERGRK